MVSALETSATGPQLDDRLPCSVSIVIEWENVVLAGDERALRMLRSLAGQIEQLLARPGISAEVIVVVDSSDDAEQIEPMLREHFPVELASLSLRAVGAGGVKYHDKKNVGAAAAAGEIIVFLDSDVIPEDGWLERIYKAFASPDVKVVAGATYLDHRGVYSSAMAAFWFFPPRNSRDQLEVADTLFANNIAFRRDLFLANPFPALDQFRGQCRTLLDSLKSQGVPIHQHSGARCSHPAPNGIVHFVKRAVCEGHDNVVSRRRLGETTPIRVSYWTLRRRVPLYLNRIRENGSDVGLSRTGAVIARFIAVGYALAMTTGEQMTRISPSFVRRWFSI